MNCLRDDDANDDSKRNDDDNDADFDDSRVIDAFDSFDTETLSLRDLDGDAIATDIDYIDELDSLIALRGQSDDSDSEDSVILANTLLGGLSQAPGHVRSAFSLPTRREGRA